jgi:iron complex outermembrane receptor protein
LRRYEGIGPSAEHAAVDARRISGRLAALGDFEVLRDVSVRPLVALECHDTSIGDATACDALEPTGRFGALGVFGEFSAFGGAGRYVRLPTLGELHGMSVVVRGSPRLENETGTTLDAGARYTHRLEGEIAPLWAAVSAYTRESSELISFVRTEQGYVVPVNVGEARVHGVEIEAGAGFLRHFAADAAVTALDARDRTPERMTRNDILPHRSRLVVALAVRATTGPTGYPFAEELSLGARHVYQASRYADLAGLKVIPEQHSLDIDASVRTLDGMAALRARMVNALDTRRWDVVGFPLPGRSFFVSLEATL